MREGSGRATAKGQIVIPVAMRRKYGIRKGTRVTFSELREGIFVQPVTPEYVAGLRGRLKNGKGKRATLRALMADRRGERML
jgi:AbrB family looped-hinge helix DNA binding protein